MPADFIDWSNIKFTLSDEWSKVPAKPKIPDQPLFTDSTTEALWIVSKETECPKTGVKSYEGRFTLIDIPAARAVQTSARIMNLPEGTYLVHEDSRGRASLYTSGKIESHASFLQFATHFAMHKGELPQVKSKIRKRPGSQPAEPPVEVNNDRPVLGDFLEADDLPRPIPRPARYVVRR